MHTFVTYGLSIYTGHMYEGMLGLKIIEQAIQAKDKLKIKLIMVMNSDTTHYAHLCQLVPALSRFAPFRAYLYRPPVVPAVSRLPRALLPPPFVLLPRSPALLPLVCVRAPPKGQDEGLDLDC